MRPFIDDTDLKVYVGDCRDVLGWLPDESVHCVVTSPPYWGLRDYGIENQLGLEPTPGEYVEKLVGIFREVHRVLHPDGTCWLNLGDTFANKQLQGIPWRVAFALQDDGWYLRSEIIWSKNAMPESVTDRPTKSHEQVFLFTRSRSYFYDQQAIMEPAEWARWGTQTNHKHEGSESAASWIKPKSKKELQERGRRLNPDRGDGGGGGFYPEQGWRNARSVWYITTDSYEGAHFATMPQELVRRCVKAGCPEGGVVLDPFGGAGTTGLVARQLGRHSVLIELSAEYARLIAERTSQLSLLS